MNNPLVQLINRIVDNKLQEFSRQTPSFWVVQVVGSSGSVAQNSNASVYVNGDTSSTPITLKNKSNETLTANNQCYAFSPSGSLSDAVILIKK